MNATIRAYLSTIGRKGGSSGTGKAKARAHTGAAMLRYWAEVKAGTRPGPKRRKRSVTTQSNSSQCADP